MKMDNTEHYKTLVAAYENACEASGTKASKLTAAKKLWNQVETSKEDYKNALLDLKAKSARNEERAFKWCSNLKTAKEKYSVKSNTNESGSFADSTSHTQLSEHELTSTSPSKELDCTTASYSTSRAAPDAFPTSLS